MLSPPLFIPPSGLLTIIERLVLSHSTDKLTSATHITELRSSFQEDLKKKVSHDQDMFLKLPNMSFRKCHYGKLSKTLKHYRWKLTSIPMFDNSGAATIDAYLRETPCLADQSCRSWEHRISLIKLWKLSSGKK